MRLGIVGFASVFALLSSGCFLVGYDGVGSDAGSLPGIKTPDASPQDSGMDAGALDHEDAGMDAGPDTTLDADWDADLTDADLPDADLDAQMDSGDAGDAGEPTVDAESPDDAGDAGDAGDLDAGDEPTDAGPDASAPDAGRDSGVVPPVDPKLQCDGNAVCDLQCPNIPACTASCNTNNACDIDCSGTTVCNALCNKSFQNVCEVDCRYTGTCNTTCKGAGDCKVDCRNSGNCKKTRCEGIGTQCMLVCSPNDPNCGFEYCWGDTIGILDLLTVSQQRCAGNVVTCGGYTVPSANLPCQPK